MLLLHIQTKPALCSLSSTSCSLKPKPVRFLSHQALHVTVNVSLKPCVLKASYFGHLPLPSSHQRKRKRRRHKKFASILHTYHSLSAMRPYILSENRHILLGWLCSLVSVFSLSHLVPRIGKFSSSLRKFNSIGLRNEVAVLGVLFLAKLLATYGQQAFLWVAALNAVYKIRIHVFQSVLERELRFFEGENGASSGDIAFRITTGATDVADALHAFLSTIVPSILQCSVMATQMLVMSPTLSFMSAMVIPCMGFAIAFLGERYRKISKEAHISIAMLSSHLNEILPAIFFIKANNSEPCETSRFERLARADLSYHLQKKKMRVLVPQIIQAVYVGSIFILCAGSLVVSSGCVNISSTVSFLTSLIFLIEPIQEIGKAYNELKQGEPAIERLFDLIGPKSKVIEKPDLADLDYVVGDVKFCDVSFKYGGEDDPLILNGLNLHIKAGETVAVVGPSGGGKTTLIKLLLRVYDPVSGCILVDDRDVRNIRLDSLRRHVGLVSQDVIIFSGTVAENIGYRDLLTEIDMEKVELAAQTAGADEFIKRLPMGYHTHVGPRGSSLSGGQKQRLAIARAIYQESSILILDEATSALDSRSESLARHAVSRLMKNQTVLVIAHRLETALMATRIFHLDNCKLEEISRLAFVRRLHGSSPSCRPDF